MGEFRMPSLGADMDVGTILEWLVKPGDTVTRGQIVAVVDTAKAAIEIEAFESGVVQEILVDVGVQVPVGTPLAMIGAGAGPLVAVGPVAGAPVAAAPVAAAPVAAAPIRASVGAPVPAPVTTSPAVTRTRHAPKPAPKAPSRPSAPAPPGPPPHLARPATARATPPVRHLAHQLGVDLDQVTGTGPDGHVTHDDVVAAAAVPSLGTPDAVAAATPPGRLRVTPRARRIAAERGIDLATLAPAAPGILTGDEVEQAARARLSSPPLAREQQHVEGRRASAAPAPQPPPVSDAAAAGAERGDRKAAMRTAIANLMSRSNTEIPHYHVTQMMDLAPALAWLRTHNAELPVAKRLLPAVLFLRATVLAALAVPDLNGHWTDGALHRAARVDLGVAVATRGGGLVTPAIPDAGPLGIDELMASLRDLVGRARRGNLKQAEMAGASITVSSLGEAGADALYGVIFPPQVALVGVGGIVERPWAVDGMLTVRPTAMVTLAADHRASDGRTASAFLAAFAHALAHPEEL